MACPGTPGIPRIGREAGLRAPGPARWAATCAPGGAPRLGGVVPACNATKHTKESRGGVRGGLWASTITWRIPDGSTSRPCARQVLYWCCLTPSPGPCAATPPRSEWLLTCNVHFVHTASGYISIQGLASAVLNLHRRHSTIQFPLALHFCTGPACRPTTIPVPNIDWRFHSFREITAAFSAVSVLVRWHACEDTVGGNALATQYAVATKTTTRSLNMH